MFVYTSLKAVYHRTIFKICLGCGYVFILASTLFYVKGIWSKGNVRGVLDFAGRHCICHSVCAGRVLVSAAVSAWLALSGASYPHAAST